MNTIEYGEMCYKHGYEDRDKEIVRCKECKYMRTLYDWIHGQEIEKYYCKRFCDSEIGKVELNDYCSKGERKGEKLNDSN